MREYLAIREHKESDDWRTFAGRSLLGNSLLLRGCESLMPESSRHQFQQPLVIIQESWRDSDADRALCSEDSITDW